MLSEQQILDSLDNANKRGYYCQFVQLGHVCSYLIDCRLNVFRNGKDQWAVAIERLGFSPSAGVIELEIYYYGNCLTDLEEHNGQSTNYYMVYPIDWENFLQTTDESYLRPEVRFWLVRGEKIPLSHNKQDYQDAGIELRTTGPVPMRHGCN